MELTIYIIIVRHWNPRVFLINAFQPICRINRYYNVSKRWRDWLTARKHILIRTLDLQFVLACFFWPLLRLFLLGFAQCSFGGLRNFNNSFSIIWTTQIYADFQDSLKCIFLRRRLRLCSCLLSRRSSLLVVSRLSMAA